MFCLKLRGNEQIIVFLSIETHLIASHVFMMSEPSIIILITIALYMLQKIFFLAVAIAVEEQKLNQRHHGLYTFLCLKAFHSYETRIIKDLM